MTENTVISLEEIEASARLDDVTEPLPSMPEEPADLDPDQREAIAHMVRQAKDAGIALTGPDGLLKALTAQIVEAALDEELNEHLGYDKHDPIGAAAGTPATGPGPRPCSPTPWVPLTFRSRGTTTAPSNPSWSRNANGDCRTWTRWC